MIDVDPRMSVRQSRAIAGAVALFAFAAVVLEIGLVRMFSALLGQHFGLLWAALFPLGAGLGALVGVFATRAGPNLFRAAPLAHIAAFTAPAAALTVIFGIRARSVDNFDVLALKDLALFLGTSLLPFVLVGALFSRALGMAKRQAGAVLQMAFVAAACAVVASAFLMRFGPARIGLGVAVTFSLSALLFARASRFDDDGARANLSLVITFVLGSSVVLAGEIGAPYLKLASLRWTGIERFETQIWTHRGFYTVDKPQSNSALLRVDGTFGTSIVDGKQLPPLSPDEMAYLLHRGKDPVLVVGVGGGREVRAALRQGQKDVRGVEQDVTIARDVMRGSSYSFSGELYDKPEVKIAVEGARNYVRRHLQTFQRIVLGFTETHSAASVGALAAVPNSTLTTEFVQDLLAALAVDGTLTISRPDAELDRVLALVAHALRAKGSTSPSAHVFGCAKDKVVTVLVKRSSLQQDELNTLRTHCRRHKFAEVASPDAVKDEGRRAIMAGLNPLGVSLGQTADLRPPTEDRPFWHFTAAPGRVFQAMLDARGMVERQRVLLVVTFGSMFAVVAALLTLLVSLGLSGRFWGYQSRPPVTRVSISLAAVAMSIVLLAHAFMGRMGPMVGRPDVAGLFLPLVFLFSLSLGAGLGRRFDEDDIRAGLQRWALATSFLMAPLLMAFDDILDLTIDLPLLARIGIFSTMIGTVGGGLGVSLGLAVRIASTWGVRACSCAIGFAGTLTAFAWLGGTLLSMCWGYSASLIAGSISIMSAAIFAASSRIDVPREDAHFQPMTTNDTALDDEPAQFDQNVSPSNTY